MTNEVTRLSQDVTSDRQAILGDREILKTIICRLDDIERRIGLDKFASIEDPKDGELKPCRSSNMQLKHSYPDIAIEAQEEDEEDEDHFCMDYDVGGTLWDAPIIVGLQKSKFASIALMLSMFLNAVTQLYICFVLIDSNSFVKTGYWEALAEQGKQWRRNEAHEESEVDATGQSLASRVCRQDATLSVAGKQVTTLVEINSYLGLETGEMDWWPTKGGTGPMLCSVCIVMFIVVILKEFRSICTGLLAVFSLPKGKTRVINGRYISISRHRLAVCVFMAIIRAFVAASILYVGTMWLTYTSSTTDLILNAAALSWIMEMDELLYETTVPAETQKWIANLEPLKYWRPHLHMEAVLPAVSLAGLTTWAVAFLVFPHAYLMVDVKKEMCQGWQGFYVGVNPAGYAVSFVGSKGVNQSARVSTIQSYAVEELIHYDDGPLDEARAQYSFIATAKGTFTRQVGQSLQGMASTAVCVDLDVVNNGSIITEVPSWFNAIRNQIGRHVDNDMTQRPFRCSEYAANCTHSGILRNVCPHTCGCHDPYSSEIVRDPYLGCPNSCSKQIAAVVAQNTNCTNMDLNDPFMKGRWVGWWQQYYDKVVSLFPQVGKRPEYYIWIQYRMKMGCNDNGPDPVAGHYFCDENALFLRSVGISTIKGFCPELCCKGENPPALCPPSCSASR